MTHSVPFVPEMFFELSHCLSFDDPSMTLAATGLANVCACDILCTCDQFRNHIPEDELRQINPQNLDSKSEGVHA